MRLVASVRPSVRVFVYLFVQQSVFVCQVVCLFIFKVKGHRSRSNVWRPAVDIRGSALPSAAKANNYRQV